MITNKTYIGVVVDNQDPKKIGRIKVSVLGIYEDMSTEDMPWAIPWKDLNGNVFNIPELGKVVIIVFDQDDRDSPEYIYAEHYNVNLENKLSKLSDEDYISMKSLIFDHKTQIYTNDSEGLIIDHKFQNINLTEDGINLNLKDNNNKLNIGDAKADQQVILGNHFFEWMNNFLNALQSGGLFNGGGPTVPNPSLIKLIIEFQAMKDLKFLSHHVNIVDNNKVTTVKSNDRENESQYGDKWTSTQNENIITEKKSESFEPKTGPSEEFNQPVEISDKDAEIIANNIIDTIGTEEIDENILSILQAIDTKEDLSKIDSFCLDIYDKSLIDIINTELTSDSFTKAKNIIENIN